MYLIKIFRYASGNELLISVKNFEILSGAINVYRDDIEDTSFLLHENDHVYVMNHAGETVDHVLIKEKKD
jgi:hypothetical protein